MPTPMRIPSMRRTVPRRAGGQALRAASAAARAVLLAGTGDARGAGAAARALRTERIGGQQIGTLGVLERGDPARGLGRELLDRGELLDAAQQAQRLVVAAG